MKTFKEHLKEAFSEVYNSIKELLVIVLVILLLVIVPTTLPILVYHVVKSMTHPVIYIGVTMLVLLVSTVSEVCFIFAWQRYKNERQNNKTQV